MSIIKKFKVYKGTGESAVNETYDLGADSSNIDYSRQNITNVKAALDDLYTKSSSEEGGSSSSSEVTQKDLDKLKKSIGFTSNVPLKKDNNNNDILDTSSDFCFKDIVHTFVKIRCSSESSRTVEVQGIANKIDATTFKYDSRMYDTDSSPDRNTSIEIYFNKDWSSLKQFINSQKITLGEKLRVQLKIKPNNLALFSSTDNEWHIVSSNDDYITLTSDEWTSTANVYHLFNFTYTYTNGSTSSKITNITKIGTALSTSNISKSLAPTSNDNILTSFLDLVYPVGSIYMSVNGTPPNYLFGGTWQAIEGRFLLGQGTYDINQFTPYGLGDEKGRQDTVLIKHNHNVTARSGNVSGTTNTQGAHTHTRGSSWYDKTGGKNSAYIESGKTYKTKTLYTGSAGNHSHTVSIAKSNIASSFTINEVTQNNMSGSPASTLATPGIGKNTGNLPPYLVVNMWKRIA